MGPADQLSRGAQAERLARGAADWLIDSSGLDPGDPSLYHGLAGMVLALHEAHQHFGDDRYRQAVAWGADVLSAQVDGIEGCSLYFGLAGGAFALRALGEHAAADRALNKIRCRFDGERWNEMFELFVGNAGIGLGALRAGDLDLAVTAVIPYLTTDQHTPCGVNWAVRPSPARSHHIAHGTLGIAYALASIGDAPAAEDMIDMRWPGRRTWWGETSRSGGFPRPALRSTPPPRPHRALQLRRAMAVRRPGLSPARPDNQR